MKKYQVEIFETIKYVLEVEAKDLKDLEFQVKGYHVDAGKRISEATDSMTAIIYYGKDNQKDIHIM